MHKTKELGPVLLISGLLFTLLTFSVLVNHAAPEASPAREKNPPDVLSVKSRRPVADAVRELEQRYAWTITYEDPLYVNESEIVDVTNEVRRDLDLYKPGQAPKVFVPKGGAFSVPLEINSSTGKPIESPESVVQQILTANAAAGLASGFEVHRDDGMLHVVPNSYKDKSGALIRLRSIMDAIVTIPPADRTGEESLKLLCDAVGNTSQVTVHVGTHDPNLFFHSQNHIGVRRERAVVFLVRLLRSLSTDSPHSWQLFYDPTNKDYALNIHQVTY